jgi:lincosamide nucleotidyltransferase A/C/D/E
LGDDRGRLVDIHTYTFDPAGRVVFGVEYPFDSLNGSGSVNGVPVKCITPEWMVKFHGGYQLDENDYHDVKLLCQKFGFPLPPEYEKFKLKEG